MQHFGESLLEMWVCMDNEQVLSECVCAGVMKESRVYIFLCVCALCLCTFPHPWRVVWGILCRFCWGGRWVLGVLHSDVISPDNGLVKAGILSAPSPFDCVGQLWRNGHYLPVSSIKKPPCPSYPALGFPQGEGHGPVTHWSGESESNHNTASLAKHSLAYKDSPRTWTTLFQTNVG